MEAWQVKRRKFRGVRVIKENMTCQISEIKKLSTYDRSLCNMSTASLCKT